jgi:hypothetical protein
MPICERSLTNGARSGKVPAFGGLNSTALEEFGVGGGIDLLSRSFRGARRAGLAGLLLAASLIAAAPAGAQTETTTTTPVPGAPVGEAPPADLATILPGGLATIPASAPYAVARAIQAANRIRTKPYIWGGGHRRWKSRGYDCSGAVSYVLHAAGVLNSPLVSGQLARWGMPGPGSWITIYANRSHVYMTVAGVRFDTSPRGEWIDQGRGPRWRYTLRMPTGFAIRHYPGL